MTGGEEERCERDGILQEEEERREGEGAEVAAGGEEAEMAARGRGRGAMAWRRGEARVREERRLGLHAGCCILYVSG